VAEKLLCAGADASKLNQVASLLPLLLLLLLLLLLQPRRRFCSCCAHCTPVVRTVRCIACGMSALMVGCRRCCRMNGW
jgi:hypothetical protein